MRLCALEAEVDMKNNKGMTIMEIVVSIALISIVLIFLMSLFIQVRSTHNESNVKSDYEMLAANTIKAIGDDIDKYGLYDVVYEQAGDKSSVIFTFNAFRLNHLDDRVKKVLRVYFRNNNYYISYTYESKYTADITSAERITGMVRELPINAYLDSSNYILLERTRIGEDELIEVKIPIEDEHGNIYDINVYGLIKKMASTNVESEQT